MITGVRDEKGLECVTCFGMKGVAYGAATALGKNWGGGSEDVFFLGGDKTTHKRMADNQKVEGIQSRER